MKKIILLTLVLCGFVLDVTAQSYEILYKRDTTVKVAYSGITLGSRAVKRYIYKYPSQDANGNLAYISGVIMVPSEIVDGTTPCDGIILFNRATLSKPEDAPSTGNTQLLNGLIANPLKPNYILVMSDFIGYGIAKDYPMFYHSGDVNARNSLDGLLSARQILKDENIPLGRYQFNMGFSQGGSETLYVAKLRDMDPKYKDIHFDKTFAGGGPTDYVKAYEEYVKKDWCEDTKDVVMMLVSAIVNLDMNISYSDIFKEPLASHIQELVDRKEKAVFNECGIEMEDSLSHLLQPEYMDLNSEKAKAFMQKLEEINLMNHWEPDTTQKYFIAHSRHDNFVPVQCVRAIIPWMTEKGFQPSIVPGKSNLQTNTLMFKLGHTGGAIVWLIQTMAAIQVWPVMYYEGEQNRFYHDVVHDMDIYKIIKIFESWGIDLRKLFQSSSAPLEPEGNLDIAGNLEPRRIKGVISGLLNLFPSAVSALEKVNLTPEDVEEMLEDAGITEADLLKAYLYLKSTPSAPEVAENIPNFEEVTYLTQMYEQTLSKWVMLAGFDVQYSTW